jgi:hypothetical protein
VGENNEGPGPGSYVLESVESRKKAIKKPVSGSAFTSKVRLSLGLLRFIHRHSFALMASHTVPTTQTARPGPQPPGAPVFRESSQADVPGKRRVSPLGGRTHFLAP